MHHRRKSIKRQVHSLFWEYIVQKKNISSSNQGVLPNPNSSKSYVWLYLLSTFKCFTNKPVIRDLEPDEKSLIACLNL